MYTDDFGYIPKEFRASWTTGSIEPVPGFAAAVEWVTERMHPDGYVYPPQVHTVTEHLDGTVTPVPRSERHAFLWSAPPTHCLSLPQEQPGEETRRGIGGFAIHFAGFLHGYRSQFTEWWIDGRLAAKPQTDLAHVTDAEVSSCFSTAMASWSSWSVTSRRVMTNALYFHNRVPMYEWDWERFQAEYQVMDAFYAVARRELNTPRVKHHERLATLCAQFDIVTDLSVFAEIARYRNALTHEVIWGEGMPGEGFVEGYRKGELLRHINQRLGLAILGVSAAYVRSSWASLMSCFLDLGR